MTAPTFPAAEPKLQPIRAPASLVAMLAVAAFFTLQLGILPGALAHVLTPFLCLIWYSSVGCRPGGRRRAGKRVLPR